MSKFYIYAWDLDETIGNFIEYGMIWDAMRSYYDNKLTNKDFNRMLDLFPNYFRTGIWSIFKILKRIKQTNLKNVKVVIYTNNQGPHTWTDWIAQYIENKINYKLFDQIIRAYEIDGMRVEKCRTSHEKKHADLLKCMNLPVDSEICFIDDQLHPEMKENSLVKYLHIKPYTYSYPFSNMIDKILSNKIKKVPDVINFRKKIKDYIDKYNYVQPKIITSNNTHLETKKYIKKGIIAFSNKFTTPDRIKNKPKTRKLRTRKSHTYSNKIYSRRRHIK